MKSDTIDKLVWALVIATAIGGFITLRDVWHRKELWNSLPFPREHYQEPTLSQRSGNP